MRVVRWRRVLVPMMVLVAGCLPRSSAPDLPASLVSGFGQAPPTFTVLPPPEAVSGEDVVARLRPDTGEPMFDGRAVPLFIGVDCHGDPQCSTTALGAPGGRATAWVVLYPDCTDPEGDIGWVLLDGVQPLAGAYTVNTPCEP